MQGTKRKTKTAWIIEGRRIKITQINTTTVEELIWLREKTINPKWAELKKVIRNGIKLILKRNLEVK